MTWRDVELPSPWNTTKGKASGNMMVTGKPLFHGSPTAPKPEGPFTLDLDVEATTIP